MPLKLIPPRQGRSQNWRIRGTYYRQYVDRSAGTREKRLAQKLLGQIKADIEGGLFARPTGPTFTAAARDYMRAGGARRYMEPLILHFATSTLDEVDQAAIENAAAVLCPDAGPATRNRCVYTPVSAVLKHAGRDFRIRRPKGGDGEERRGWLWPEEADAVFDAAGQVDLEFRLYLLLLCYTGLRKVEGLSVTVNMTRLQEAAIHILDTKNGEQRPVHLPPFLVVEIANHPRGLDRAGEKLFGFSRTKASGLLKATVALCAPELQAKFEGVQFHMFRHTWGTWMRRYAKLDTRGLVGTKAWKSMKAAGRYEHVDISEEARKADLLPVPKAKRA